MKPKAEKAPERKLEWRVYGPCYVCGETLLVANTGPESAEMKHLHSGLSWSSCNKQRRNYAKQV